jgi:hypothetical protein
MIDKRLIFTVTTGRSGTDYLARMLACVPGVVSEHEPRPHFVWAMRKAQGDPGIARKFLVEEKLPAIRRAKGRVYSETSHLVCKGFLEPLAEMGYRPDLILLRRPHREVALSMYRLGTIPGRTEKALKWYLTPDDPGVLPLENWQRLHDYQLCYWYCLEIERRRQEYGRMFSDLGSRVVDISLQELATFGGFMRLRKELALPRILVPPTDWYRYLRRYRVRANTQSRSKSDVDLPGDLDAFEAVVQQTTPPAQAIVA